MANVNLNVSDISLLIEVIKMGIAQKRQQIQVTEAYLADLNQAHKEYTYCVGASIEASTMWNIPISEVMERGRWLKLLLDNPEELRDAVARLRIRLSDLEQQLRHLDRM